MSLDRAVDDVDRLVVHLREQALVHVLAHDADRQAVELRLARDTSRTVSAGKRPTPNTVSSSFGS